MGAVILGQQVLHLPRLMGGRWGRVWEGLCSSWNKAARVSLLSVRILTTTQGIITSWEEGRERGMRNRICSEVFWVRCSWFLLIHSLLMSHLIPGVQSPYFHFSKGFWALIMCQSQCPYGFIIQWESQTCSQILVTMIFMSIYLLCVGKAISRNPERWVI